MSRDEIRKVVLDELGELAPEADLDSLDPDVDIREELDIDSFDYTRLLASLSEMLGQEISDADYGKLVSLSGIVDYFA